MYCQEPFEDLTTMICPNHNEFVTFHVITTDDGHTIHISDNPDNLLPKPAPYRSPEWHCSYWYIIENNITNLGCYLELNTHKIIMPNDNDSENFAKYFQKKRDSRVTMPNDFVFNNSPEEIAKLARRYMDLSVFL